MPFARPKIFEPTLRIYDRPVHPEFFRIVATQRLDRERYGISSALTTAGHVLTWTDGERMLCEVVDTNFRELPEPLVLDPILNERPKTPVTVPKNAFYGNVSQIIEVPPMFFHDMEKELLRDTETDGLLYRFGYSGRMNLGGVSYLGVESRSRSIRIRAVHTFPDDGVLIKTETKIRLD